MVGKACTCAWLTGSHSSGWLRVWASAALPRLLPPRQAGLRLLPRLWLVLVGALHVPATQVTASTDAEAEQSVSAACCTLVTHREQDWSHNAVACCTQSRYRIEGLADKLVQEAC